MDLNDEEWKDIKDLPQHQISNKGRIRNKKSGYILKQRVKGGYNQVTLSNYLSQDIRKTYLVHRLVALTFIPNPENFKIVDHIDRNKLNNNLENLRWCSASTNGLNRDFNIVRKEVIQYDMQGEFIKLWDSVSDIEKVLGFNSNSIRKCLNNFSKSNNGFLWKYEKENIKSYINLDNYKCIGNLKGLNFSNYFISKCGAKFFNIKTQKEISYRKDNYGYLKIQLRVNNKYYIFLVHKIINQVLKNGKYEDIIDHVDGDKSNNSLDNLEVVTLRENTVRAMGKSVQGTHITTGEIKVFRNIRDAGIFLNIVNITNISYVCKGKRSVAYGYFWKYI